MFKKIKRILEWIPLLWNLEYNYKGLFRIISYQTGFMIDDLKLDSSEYNGKNLYKANEIFYTISNSDNNFQEVLNKGTEAIRKSSYHWK